MTAATGGQQIDKNCKQISKEAEMNGSPGGTFLLITYDLFVITYYLLVFTNFLLLICYYL